MTAESILAHRPPREGEQVTYITEDGAWVHGYCLAVHDCHVESDRDGLLFSEETVTKATIAEYSDHSGVRSWSHVPPFDPETHDGTLDAPAPETFVLGWHDSGGFLAGDDRVLYECTGCGLGPTVLYQRASRVRYVTNEASCHAECHECGTVRTFEPVEDQRAERFVEAE